MEGLGVKRFRKMVGFCSIISSYILLTACGGGGGQTNYDRLSAKGGSLAEEAETLLLSEGYSDPSTLPNAGVATYNGVVGVVTLSESLVVLGELELVADFNGAGTISGAAQNFSDNQNNSYGGSIVLSNGIIDRTANTDIEYTFSADADGTLSDSSDDYQVDGFLRGDFVGDTREFAEGLIEGTVTSSLGPEGFIGGFVAKQQ